MKRIGFYLVLAVGLLGCAERFEGLSGAMSDRAVVLSMDVSESAAGSKAVVVNGTALTGVQFLRKDGPTPPTDFSGAVVVVGNRATNGNITFTPSVPRYKLNNDRCYFRAYHPVGSSSGNLVTWGVDGKTDIVVGSVFDAGNYQTPITGPMIFDHILAQLEVVCVVDPSVSVSEALVQLVWGSVTKIELMDSYSSVSLSYATGAVSGSGAMGAVALLKEDYATAFSEQALTKAGIKAAAMLVPAVSGVAPLKLRVTTKLGGAQEVSVQLKSGSTNMGFEVGRKHTITLQFNAADKQILVAGTKVSDWGSGYSSSVEVEP